MWRDEAYLLDMVLAARKILKFTEGFTIERFLADEVVQHAVMRLIQILGEASRKISLEYKKGHPEIQFL